MKMGSIGNLQLKWSSWFKPLFAQAPTCADYSLLASDWDGLSCPAYYYHPGPSAPCSLGISQPFSQLATPLKWNPEAGQCSHYSPRQHPGGSG